MAFSPLQVEHVLIDRLVHFMDVDLKDAKVLYCATISSMMVHRV